MTDSKLDTTIASVQRRYLAADSLWRSEMCTEALRIVSQGTDGSTSDTVGKTLVLMDACVRHTEAYVDTIRGLAAELRSATGSEAN